MAFTQNVNPTFVRQPNMGFTQITTGTGSSGSVTIYTGGSSNGTMVKGIIGVSNGTTSAFDVQWGVTNGGTFFVQGTSSVTVGSGSTSGIIHTNFFANAPALPKDSDGNQFFFLRSSVDTLTAKSPATSSTWTTGATIILSAIVGDF